MNRYMKESGQILPPPWCSQICRNAMNDVCIEHCAIKRDCSWFEPAKDLKLMDLPRFPNTTNMTREERFAVVTVYLAKMFDHLQGESDEYIPLRRPHIDSQASSRVSSTVQVKDLLHDLTQAIPPPQIGEERQGAGVGSEELAEPTD